MSKKNRLIGLLCIAVLCSRSLCAQPRQMGIEELFRLADEQSKSIQTYRTATEAAGEALKAAKAQRLPDVNVSLSASYLGNGKLWDRDFGNTTTVEMPHFGNNFALEAQQVIYAGGAISSGIRQAELGKLMAQLNLQKNVQEIRFLLVGHYLNLYKLDNQIKVLQRNLQLTREVIANYRETQLPHIKEGAEVAFTADAVPGVVYKGVVESISEATGAAFSLIPQDNATGNFVKVEQRVPVRIRLKNNNTQDVSRLRAGFNVECEIKY